MAPQPTRLKLKVLACSFSIAHKANLKQMCGDIGNVYVNATTNEKVFTGARPEFGDYKGCTIIIIKVLYGLCSLSGR